MKILPIIALAILLVTFVASAQNKTPSAVEAPTSSIDTTVDERLVKELTSITSEIYDGAMSSNRSVIEKYLADDFLETDVQGSLRDKRWNLDNIPAGNEKIQYKIEEPQVRVHGDVAILYYRWNLFAAGRKLQVMDTFIRTSNRWRLLASSRVVLTK